jgi:type IV secretory pathway protease TraF
MSRGSWLALVVVGVVGGLMAHTWLTGQHTTINLTGSLPQWAFSCRPYQQGQSLGVGMYVRFLPPVRVQNALRTRGVVISGTIPWIKQVTAVQEGESGRMVLVEGTAPDSFDSRHWGPLLVTEIQEVCVPWW